MDCLHLTLPTPEANLAVDEALLDGGGETLRIWEAATPMVVVGRASRVAEEVRLDACRRRGVPVLRRLTGGAAIVSGPGCLMYAVTLDLDQRPELRAIDRAHAFVMAKNVNALQRLNPTVHAAGVSDLAIRPGGSDSAVLKFSGNSVRVARDRLLYHGTVLYNFDLSLIADLLDTAPRQPAYRRGRSHAAFVGNLGASPIEITDALRDGWQADGDATPPADEVIRRLVDERYRREEWNHAR